MSMVKFKPCRRQYESGDRRPVESEHSPRQKAIKQISRNSEIKTMMKDLVLGVEAEGTEADTYAPMRKMAASSEKIGDILVDDEAINGGLFLAHFHAMQAVYGKEPDDWDLQPAAADWQSSMTKKIPSGLVHKAIFGSKIDG